MLMKEYRIAIVGLGATGTVLAAVLLRKDPNTILVGRSNDIGKTLLKEGIRVSGALSFRAPVKN
jgi:ketopantoate reductase